MSRLVPYTGPNKGFGIEKGDVIKNLRVTDRSILPAISSANLPPPVLHGSGGGIAYDLITNRPYYSNGVTWLPFGSGGGSGGSSYTFIKNTNQRVAPNTDTGVIDWESSSQTVYHTVPEWNLSTGIYTASSNVFLSIAVNLSWSSNSNNLGERILRVQYRQGGTIAWITIKEVKTQVDPNISVETTQECQINLELTTGDAVRISVEQDVAGRSADVASGNHTSVSGLQFAR